jgi:hypothetical protein
MNFCDMFSAPARQFCKRIGTFQGREGAETRACRHTAAEGKNKEENIKKKERAPSAALRRRRLLSAFAPDGIRRVSPQISLLFLAVSAAAATPFFYQSIQIRSCRSRTHT